jgi:hypothetical protein
MEHLFSPCTRYRDILENQGRLEQFRGRGQGQHPEIFQELNLNVPAEELLRTERALTDTDLYAVLGDRDGNTVAWLTPHAVVARRVGIGMRYWMRQDESYHFHFTADGKAIIAYARTIEHLLEICNIVLQLLTVSVVHSLGLRSRSLLEDTFIINAQSLVHLMEQCQSLKALLLSLEMNEDQCRALGAYSRPDLEIVLSRCKITSAGANALAEFLGRNQGPTKLDSCYIDNIVLADGLRGNSRLKLFTPLISSNLEVGSRELLAIAGALRENKGLVELTLTYSSLRLNDETWGAISGSLKAHPTLELLNLRGAFTVATATPALLKFQTQKLVAMMKVNTSIHTIHLRDNYSEHALFRESVIPYLETNRLRPRVRAIQMTRPIAYRAKVLGRTLLAVRTDPNRLWMLLSGNAEIASPSKIAAATKLSMPAGAAATTIATGSLPRATADATAATSAAIHATTFASTVAAAAAPSADQKRKARP